MRKEAEGQRTSRRRVGAKRPVRRLLEALQDRRKLLILTHDNPDPDAIASAHALRYLLDKSLYAESTICFGGIVGRAENSAMLCHLNIELRHISQVDPKTFDAIALVDTQPGAGNYSLPVSLRPSVVIDHHPPRDEGRDVEFFDVRPEYGATSTILAEYLWQSGAVIRADIATALLFGIKTETQDLVRMAGRIDVDTYLRLYPLANVRLLAEIQRPKLLPSYFQDLCTGLRTAVVYDRVAVCTLASPAVPDMVAELADFLLRVQGVEWSICFGYFAEQLFISVRTSEPGANAGEIVQQVIAGQGSAGGHDVMAGARIFSLPASIVERERLEQGLKARFLKALGVAGAEGHRLLSASH